MNPSEALKYIDSLDKFGINLGLSRISMLMEALGNPQLSYPCAHIAGTNGKGSVCAFTSSVLSASGLKTGLYTSPPLEFFGERARINGELMREASLPALLQKVIDAAKKNENLAGLTQFEVITALSFDYFAEEKIDFGVIEVGMGGRLDSTNVINPVACAITNVSLEHSEQLGPTEALIAREKAGIAKTGVPLVTAATGEALAEIRALCAEVKAPLYVNGVDFCATRRGDRYDYSGIGINLKDIACGLPGAYQRDNLAVALALLESIRGAGFAISEENIFEGIAKTRWPGRLELFGAGPRVLLDGAHNPHAAKALKTALESGFERKRLILVMGILGDKDALSIVKDLAPLADEVILTRSDSKRAISPEELVAMSASANISARLSPSLEEGWKMALGAASSEDLVVITGSLTLVGQARGILRREGWLE